MNTDTNPPTIYVADDPADTLSRAGLDTDLAEEYGRAWLATAEQVGQSYGVHVDAVVTHDGSERDDHLARNTARNPDEPDLVDAIWQAMHDAVTVDADGVRRV